MNRLKICALVVPILALAGACAGGGNQEACNLAIAAIGAGACNVAAGGGGGGNVGVGVITPVALADAASTTEGSAILVDVASNDSSGTGDTTVAAVGVTALALTTSGALNPDNGTVVVTDAAGGLVSYIPDAGFTGTDMFSYTLQDANGATATAIVTVTVLPGENPISATGTLEGLTERASFRTTSAVIASLPGETALLTRETTDGRITIGPLADPSIDFDVLIGAGGGMINADIVASFVGGFDGSDGTMNYHTIDLDSEEIAHAIIGPVLIPEEHPHGLFAADDPGTIFNPFSPTMPNPILPGNPDTVFPIDDMNDTDDDGMVTRVATGLPIPQDPPFDESDPDNRAILSVHQLRLGLLVPGPGGSNLSFASYGYWEIEGQNIFGTSYAGGAFSFGVLTEDAAVPTTGTATYAGTMHGLFSPSVAPGTVFNAQSTLSGTAALTADFGANTISASFTGITASPDFGPFSPRTVFAPGTYLTDPSFNDVANDGIVNGNGTTFLPTLVGPAGPFVDINATGTISGNGFAGTATSDPATAGATVGNGTTLTGEINGNFFGPTAEEAGGVIRLGNPGLGDQVIGAFAVGQ